MAWGPLHGSPVSGGGKVVVPSQLLDPKTNANKNHMNLD